MTVLAVVSDARVASFLVKGLRAHGYLTEHVWTVEQALVWISRHRPDLILLDITLADMDGHKALQKVRQEDADVPVIVMAGGGRTSERPQTLDRRSNGVVTKPFSFDDLLSKMRAVLLGGNNHDDQLLRAGRLVLDTRSREAQIDGQCVNLTTREFALLRTFLEHPGEVLSRQQLLSRVWGLEFDPGSNVVDVYIRYLRHKLGASILKTVRGVGYRLESGGGAHAEGVLEAT